MGHYYDQGVIDRALEAIEDGATVTAAALLVGAPRKTVQRWKRVYLVEGKPRGQVHCQVPCPVCEAASLDEEAYAELLGWYLGDGHIVKARRGVWKLSVYNDAQYVEDNALLLTTFARVKAGANPMQLHRRGMTTTYLYWKHWTCLFPQHGPGHKHTRSITLEPWQEEVVRHQPGPFLRGLFHSDGCRAANWTRRQVAGEMKRYDYPRWQFSNRSQDIRDLCCWALDLVEIPWKQSNRWIISVSRGEAVARLDELIGLKT